MPNLGEIAAIATSISWSACALFFTTASHRIGAFSMNHYRMLFGFASLLLIYIIVNEKFFPTDVAAKNFVLLAFSGVFGYFLCDSLLFQSYLDIGPRLGILVFSFYPFFSAIFAQIFLHERLSFMAWIGMAVTISGISWVVLEKTGQKIEIKGKHFLRGTFLACGAGLFQGISFTMAKPAMTGADPTDPLAATVIRALFGGAVYWLVSIVRGRFFTIVKKFSDAKSIWLIFFGSIIGSSFGVWTSMIAIKHAPVGIASTLMALMPIFILPMTAIVYKEKISYRAILGAIVTCLGIAILFNT